MSVEHVVAGQTHVVVVVEFICWVVVILFGWLGGHYVQVTWWKGTDTDENNSPVHQEKQDLEIPIDFLPISK